MTTPVPLIVGEVALVLIFIGLFAGFIWSLVKYKDTNDYSQYGTIMWTTGIIGFLVLIGLSFLLMKQLAYLKM